MEKNDEKNTLNEQTQKTQSSNLNEKTETVNENKETENEYQGLEINSNSNSVNTITTKQVQTSSGLSSSSSVHSLNSTWSIWYISRKEEDRNTPYIDRLKKIVDFNSLEDFFRYYMFLKPASKVDRNTDLSFFKQGFKPVWESCPDGAFWFFRFKKADDAYDIDLKWEKLIFALIGEQFDDSNILGAVLSIRGRETIIELWFKYGGNDIRKAQIGEKFKDLLELDKNVSIFFKDISKSMKDQSTLKNAEVYNFNKLRKYTYN